VNDNEEISINGSVVNQPKPISQSKVERLSEPNERTRTSMQQNKPDIIQLWDKVNELVDRENNRINKEE